jgi:hypothetical protein
MKMTASPSTLYIACLVISISATVRAQDAQTSAVPEREIQAKIECCKTCHGAFIEGKRTSPFMPKVAAVLSPPMGKALASLGGGSSGSQRCPLLLLPRSVG